MSIKVASAVWQLSGLTVGEKMVLLKLADQCNDAGEYAYPSVATMARDCSLSERAVQNNLRRLLDLGHLEVQEPADRARHIPTCYRVLPGARDAPGGDIAPGAESAPGDLAPGAPNDGRRVHILHAPGARGAPDPIRDPIRDPSEEEVDARARETVHALWDACLRFAGRTAPSSSDEHEFDSWIERGATVQHVAQATLAVVEWCASQNPPERPWAAFKSQMATLVVRSEVQHANGRGGTRGAAGAGNEGGPAARGNGANPATDKWGNVIGEFPAPKRLDLSPEERARRAELFRRDAERDGAP